MTVARSVAWVRPAGETRFGTGPADLEAFTRPAGGDFAAQDLTPTTAAPKYPVLAAGPDGTIALGWTEQPLADDSKAQLLVSVERSVQRFPRRQPCLLAHMTLSGQRQR